MSRSTINRWLRIFHGKDDGTKVGLFFGKPPWNKLADAVRDIIRDCRLEFPEPEIGVRTLVAQIVRAGVAVSRSTARRALKSPPKKTPPASDATKADDPPAVPAHHILKPTAINRTWPVDLTTFLVFWLTIHVLAILDGFSRKPLVLKVSLKTPNTANVLAAFKQAVTEFGPPRFVVSDHGSQFRDQFDEGLAALSKEFGNSPDKPIVHAQSEVRTPSFNGRAERFFKTLKLWQRVTLFFAAIFDIKRKAEFFQGWYNAARVHQGVDGRTPDEVWSGTPRREATRYLATDKMQPVFDVARKHHGDDPHLPIFKIKLAQFVKRIA